MERHIAASGSRSSSTIDAPGSHCSFALRELAAAADAAAALSPTDPLISGLHAELTARDIRDVVARYAGAEPLGSTSSERVKSRHAAHRDNERVVAQLIADFSIAPKATARALRFWFAAVGGYRRNVEVRFATTEKPEAVILLTAHLDSTAKSEGGFNGAVSDAPGADDNASGIGGLLAIARAVNRLHCVSRCEIRLVLFNAEEYGFAGSMHYVANLPHAPALLGAIQLDMIGHRSRRTSNGTYPFEIHCRAHDASTTAWSLAIARVMQYLTPKVAPELDVQVYPGALGTDPGQGRSDHASFHNKGIGAVAVSEDVYPGPDADSPGPSPNGAYHRYSDTAGTVDTNYAAAIARVVAAAAIVIARSYDARL